MKKFLQSRIKELEKEKQSVECIGGVNVWTE
jgi:hypothetical protein